MIFLRQRIYSTLICITIFGLLVYWNLFLPLFSIMCSFKSVLMFSRPFVTIVNIKEQTFKASETYFFTRMTKLRRNISLLIDFIDGQNWIRMSKELVPSIVDANCDLHEWKTHPRVDVKAKHLRTSLVMLNSIKINKHQNLRKFWFFCIFLGNCTDKKLQKLRNIFI